MADDQAQQSKDPSFDELVGSALQAYERQVRRIDLLEELLLRFVNTVCHCRSCGQPATVLLKARDGSVRVLCDDCSGRREEKAFEELPQAETIRELARLRGSDG